MNKYVFIAGSAIAALSFHFACGPRNTNMGYVPPANRIYADATLKTLLDSEAMGFEASKPGEKIEDSILPEPELFRLLLADSTRFIMAARKLNATEMKVFEDKHYTVLQTKIATDGIAVIVNKALDKQFVYWQQFSDMCKGKISTWDQFLPGTPWGNMQVVFDDPNSSIIRYVRDSVSMGGQQPPFFYALHSPEEVISHVEQNKNAIGFVNLAWIHEQEDSVNGGFMNRIKVLDVQNPIQGEAFSPHQAYLATKEYPLRRDIYLITIGHSAYFPFSGYITGERGQRVVLKMGLLPSTMPVRLIITRPTLDNETR